MEKSAIIVEDQYICVRAIKSLLEDLGYTVINVCDTITYAIASIAQMQPDLVCLDYSIKDGTGIEVYKKIKSRSKNSKVIFVTAHNEINILVDIYNLNPTGMVHKGDLEQFNTAINNIENNKIYYSPEQLKIITDYFNLLNKLNHIQMKYFKLFSKKMKTTSISETLNVTDRYVRKQKTAIMGKIGRASFEKYCC